MRNTKFRAYDEGNKVMHHNVQFISSGYENNDWICFVSDEAPYEKDRKEGIVLNNPYFRKQIKIMQFTGLLDRHGKEIWESDKVKCWTSTGEELIGIVEHSDGCFDVVFTDAFYDRGYVRNRDYLKVFVVNHAIEVIGTIYDKEEP